jgi:hypothetical protein
MFADKFPSTILLVVALSATVSSAQGAEPQTMSFAKQMFDALVKSPKYHSAIVGCMDRYGEKQDVRGSIDFTAPKQHHASFTPKTRFSSCLARAIDRIELPEPSTYPTSVPFIFSI